ncbi:MAG TPA: carbamoyl-phosphate synthase large subunit [SAR324 cluster bacterium]|jgi:carbamoyl-phosphate synthase large subunit|nr:carbamoyl-phosphate synthase large subunit [SAR324 cluster bacterium]MDP7498374.1 carbamoyl-phosphate synthase large subunit [SAR324 cluster bacterium]HJM07926.1 carbamoyl-phosphate synthase large subunit [SAR324 cluster bacterium]|tara:strand:+ start:28549 stop:31848 length:3300 start_codon:yes stop_codon:yes gene_type:complete
MPKRTDIESILLIGSGPIVIGQACEFDYSGTQACKALKEEGYRVILVNSNPATIMTDPGLVDATYIEPITLNTLSRIIAQEKPDALLPTMGGQTALNLAVNLSEEGVLEDHSVELIGASLDSIQMAENRESFRKAMKRIGISMPESFIVHSVEEGMTWSRSRSFPLIIRPSFTLGGAGGGIARKPEELGSMIEKGLEASPFREVLLEQSVLGWKEFEMEVMRDSKDNTVIVCSIENLDPMGVHTGDSITIAPALTLTDIEYQELRDKSLQVMREIGVNSGGSNVQFALNPKDGEILVIEMNPRVSRSSALASKATGFPIAKIAAKLAVGYSLDEIPNDITQKTPSCFEPSIDYIVTKIPRFTFEKFPLSKDKLGTQMQSVGEAMAIGRTFCESLQKAIRSLELGFCGLDLPLIQEENGVPKDNSITLDQQPTSDPSLEKVDIGFSTPSFSDETLHQKLEEPNSQRIWYLAEAMRRGWPNDALQQITKIDSWFLDQIKGLVEEEEKIRISDLDSLTPPVLKNWKQMGFSDQKLSELLDCSEKQIARIRREWSILPVFKQIDTCAAEFPSETPYYYSTYAEENESLTTEHPKVLIIGSGPNRIGQGIEFDYCCVHAVMAAKETGYEAIMLNCNPETVSTDYDISDRLYFEPVTFEDVMHVIELERPIGVIVQLGGQTPLKLAKQLTEAGITLLGTPYRSIDIAENRESFANLLKELGLLQPRNGLASSQPEALEISRKLGFPLLVRPSYVLGGRAMMIAETEEELEQFFDEALRVSPDHPVLIDEFIEDAVEVDVDLLCDGETSEIGGILEHIESAGVHSGDSACVFPPHSLSEKILLELERQARLLAKTLKVKGLMNIQFAVRGTEIFIIEANPRASRTVPFVSKSIGHPLAKYATRLMLGEKLSDLNYKYQPPDFFSIKETVFPFLRFAGSDTELGPEMKSTGEVMGRGDSVEEAYMKAQIAALNSDLKQSNVFIGVQDKDKTAIIEVARKFESAGFSILATPGTYQILEANGITDLQQTSMNIEDPVNVHVHIRTGRVSLVINTTRPRKRIIDTHHIRRMTLMYNIPYCTTVQAAKQMAESIQFFSGRSEFSYRPLPA